MVSFNASNPSEGTEYYDIIIENEPLLTECKFTRFRLPLNGNALKMMLENSEYKEMNTVIDFDKHNSIAKTIKLLRDKLKTEGIIEDEKVIAMLCTYLWNACVELEEDADSIFFKNGNGKSKSGSSGSSSSSSSKKKSEQEEQLQQQERQQKKEQEHEERIAAIRKNISSFEEWSTMLFEKYEALHNTVLDNLPNLWNAFEFALSVKTILNIKGVTLPFAGIILGPPSSLKTVVIELLKGRKNTFHTHSFSPKSFVSHSTAVPREQLQLVDMLPKIKNKLFLTPELAPIFSARDEDLLLMLSILTSVLDGHGFESDTGAQGHRGYNEDIMFTWLGAVVDIPFRVHKQLSQLGAKLYFYRLPKVEHEEDNLFNQKGDDFTNKVQVIKQALSEYLEYFDANPSITFDSAAAEDNNNKLPKIQLDGTKDEDLAHRYIIRLGMLLAPLRAIVPTWETRDAQGSEYAYSMAIIEDPTRAITQLRNLAKGHALSKGRNYIKVEDISMVINVVLSTCSIERQTIFEILLSHGGVLNTSEICDSLNITSPTARRTMTELKAIGLVTMNDVSSGTYNSEKQITLKPEFKWFLTDDFKKLKGSLDIQIWKEKHPSSTQDDNNDINSSSQNQQKHENSIKNDLQHNGNLIKDEKTIRRVDFDNNDEALGGSFSFNQNITTSSPKESKKHNASFSFGKWHCHDCNVSGDRFHMQNTDCKGEGGD